MSEEEENQLLLWWSGELDSPESVDIEKWISSCREAKDLIKRLDRQKADLRSLVSSEAELPDSFTSDVLAASESESVVTDFPQPRRNKAILPLAAVAAIALLAVGVWLLTKPGSSPVGTAVAQVSEPPNATFRQSRTQSLHNSISKLEVESASLLTSTQFRNRKKL